MTVCLYRFGVVGVCWHVVSRVAHAVHRFVVFEVSKFALQLEQAWRSASSFFSGSSKRRTC
jgi:hypothetical protein